LHGGKQIVLSCRKSAQGERGETHHLRGAGSGKFMARLSFGPEKEPVTISVGAAVSRAKDSFQAIYARADAVLYQAKQSGCNQFALAPLESGEEADP
jgi:GGDEF domain-containing protein